MASPRRPGAGKSWASALPRLQLVWRPPQAPWRHLGGVSHRFDAVVRKIGRHSILPREARDADGSGWRAEAQGHAPKSRMVAWHRGLAMCRNKLRRWRSGRCGSSAAELLA
jgi:hypothetical protein